MKHPTLLRAATAALLALGMSSAGAFAAFADDSGTTPAPVTAPAESPAAAPVEPAPAAAAAPAAAPEAAPAEQAPAEATPTDVTPTEAEASPQTEPATAPAVAGSDPVVARTEPAVDATPYKLLAWKLPCGVEDRFCAPGQQLVHVLDLEMPTLDAFDAMLVGTCGDWQVDLEWDSETTAALIAAGVLVGPNEPLEDHAYGALGDGVDPHKTIDNPDCEVAGSVAPGATVTDQGCNGTSLMGGRIATAVYPGVAYTITGPQGVVTIDPATGIAEGLAPGSYSLAYVLDPSLTSPDPGPVALTVAAYSGTCAAVVTPPVTPPTTPVVVVPAAVDPAAAAPCTAANCDLTTLALTGSDSTGLAASAGALVFVGLVLVTLRTLIRRRSTSTAAPLTETEHTA